MKVDKVNVMQNLQQDYQMLRAQMHGDLKTRYREFFESKLALEVLNHPDVVPAVAKVSARIISLMVLYRAEIIEIIGAEHKIKEELYGNSFFGRLERPQEHAREIYEDIVSTLMSKQAQMSQLLQIHCIFVYRIFENLLKKEIYLERNAHVKQEKEKLILSVFPKTLFSSKNRARIEKSDPQVSSELGIAHNKVFKKMLGQTESYTWQKAIGKFSVDKESEYFQNLAPLNMPYAAGLSHHTGSLMLGAKLYGELDQEELRQYALGTFAFLAGGGNHTFHEVMEIANRLSLGYQINDYNSCLPRSFKESICFSKLGDLFPEFLEGKVDRSLSAELA